MFQGVGNSSVPKGYLITRCAPIRRARTHIHNIEPKVSQHDLLSYLARQVLRAKARTGVCSMSNSVILATAGYDHKIRFWEAPTGVCSRHLRYPDSQVRTHSTYT